MTEALHVYVGFKDGYACKIILHRHSDTTFSSSELTGCGYPGILDRKIGNIFFSDHKNRYI